MGNSILTSLMVSGFGASGNIGKVRRQDDGETFMGIFSEKLQDRAYFADKACQPAKTLSNNKADTPIRKTGNEKRNVDVKRDFTGDKARFAADRDAAADEVSSLSEPEKTEKPEKKGAADELASLLQSLFVELNTLLSGLTGAEETATDGMAVQDAESPLEALQTMLGDALDKFQELLDQMRAISPDAGQDGNAVLLDEIEALLGKMQQNAAMNASVETCRVTGTDEGTETIADLIAQLRNQCREVADRLRSGQANGTSQVQAWEVEEGQDAAEVQSAEEDDASQEDGRQLMGSEKSSARADKASDKPHAGDSGKAEPQENAMTFDKADFAVQNQQTVQADYAQTDLRSPVIEKTTYFLSDKQMDQTVMNQVTMKIKLMAGENRQELELHLKPESLGKLTLKIIHDRGEVLARITAENEQVKSILESNMQLLKDALEKNGYSVQSLDVSVGDRNGENRAASQQEQGRREDARESGSITVAGAARPMPRSSLYGTGLPDDTQQIDLTA